MQSSIRDRIVALRRMKGSDLLPNPANWRVHPEFQESAMRKILERVGWVGAAIGYETPEGVMLIDGHLRREIAPDDEIPVLILDVSHDEALSLLAALDNITVMAEHDPAKLDALVRSIGADGEVQDMLVDILGWDDASKGNPFGDEPEHFGVTVGVGEFREVLKREVWDQWIDALRLKVGFEKEKVIAEVKRRLGL